MNFVELVVRIPLEGYEEMLPAIRRSGLKIVDLSYELFKDNEGAVEFDTSHLRVTISSNENFNDTSILLNNILRQFC